jgi:DNA polymerase-3 subunit delta'
MFSKIVGQEEAVRELREERERNRLSHAYLFEGVEGTGRLTLARAFASVILGSDCLAHPDYLELPRDVQLLKIRRFVTREGSDTEKIEHAPVLDFLHLKPAKAARRVAVIPDAERMNEAAANTFLKTLEEPPGDALLLLTCSARDRLLGTIVSRCRRVRVRPLGQEQILSALAARNLPEETDLKTISTICEGSLGLALKLASGEAVEEWHWVNGSLGDLTPEGAVKLADGMLKRVAAAGGDSQEKRQAAVRLLDLTALALRRKLRQGYSPRAAAAALQALWDAGEQIAANVRLELALHSAALEITAALRIG